MKILNLKTNADFQVYIGSDFHLNHEGPKGGTPLWESRGYKSPRDMTDGIIETLNSLVRPNDYLVYLGDWCLNTPQYKFEEDLAKIKCQNIYMIWGNHNSRVKEVYKDTVFKEFGRDDIEVYPIRYKKLVFCGDYMEMIVNGQHLCMSHYPMDVFNEMRHGAYMLCGHSHYGYDKTRHTCEENRRLDMSWDGHKKPLTIDEIHKIMDKKKLMAGDHHGRQPA